MSQMPDSIYLHKDDKYNTLGWYHAEDENTILAEHDYDESVMEDYVEYTPVYRLEEAVRKAEKDLAPLIEAATIVYEAWNGGRMDDVRMGMVELGKRFKEAKK